MDQRIHLVFPQHIQWSSFFVFLSRWRSCRQRDCCSTFHPDIVSSSAHHPSPSELRATKKKCSIILWKNIMEELENLILDGFFSVGVASGKSTENTSTCILKLCIVYGNNNAIANKARATASEVWDPMTVIDKYDITGRPVQFQWHMVAGHPAIQSMREIQTFFGSTNPCDVKSRNIFISMFNDIVYWILHTQQKLPNMRCNSS